MWHVEDNPPQSTAVHRQFTAVHRQSTAVHRQSTAVYQQSTAESTREVPRSSKRLQEAPREAPRCSKKAPRSSKKLREVPREVPREAPRGSKTQSPLGQSEQAWNPVWPKLNCARCGRGRLPPCLAQIKLCQMWVSGARRQTAATSLETQSHFRIAPS